MITRLWGMNGTRLLPILAAGALLASACTSEDARAQAQRPDTAAAASPPEVLATVGDEQITMADVRARAGQELQQLEVQYRRAHDRIVQNTLDALVRERVLGAEATRRGLSVDRLVLNEAGKAEPTEAEVSEWFRQNEARLGGRTLAELRPQIVEYLRTQRREQALATLQERLNREHDVVIKFQPYRVELTVAGAPSLGAADAPVTLVEFSDFQCPYCRTFYPRLYQLEREFRGKVKIVFLQFPLTSIHANAFKAAEASLCAHDQGKFWQLHDQLFEDQANLDPAQLKLKAQKVGLAAQTFDSCLDTGRHAARVQAELDHGSKLGVGGTPAIFINGAFLEGGALPYEALADAVRRELARVER